MNRTWNAWRNILWGIANKCIQLTAPFLLRTLIIYEIGIEYLGLDGLFISVLQVLNMAELGFSSAVVFSMYKPIAEGDKKSICALLAFYRHVYHVIGFAVLALGLLIMLFLPRLIAGHIPLDVNIYVLYSIYLLNTVIGYFLFSYRNSLLTAHQRNDIVSNLDSVLKIMQYTVQAVLVLIFKNYYAYIISLPFFTVLNNVLVQWITSRLYPEYICEGTVDHELLADIKKRVSGLMIYRFCGISRNGFDNMFLSAYLGLSVVAVYNNYFLILTGIRSVMGVISTAVTASIGSSIAAESVDKNYKDFCLFNYLYMMLSGIFAVGLFVLYQPFMCVWLGEAYMLPRSVVAAVCLYFYVLTMGDVRAIYNDAAGLWWEQRYRTLLEAAANVVLNFLFVQLWGVLGVVLASLTSLFFLGFMASAYITFDSYFGHVRLWEYFSAQGRYAAGTIVSAGAAYAVCSMIPAAGIEGLFVKAVCCLAISLLGIFLLYGRSTMFLLSRQFLSDSLSLLHK